MSPLPRASVFRLGLDGSGRETLASGLRNPVGLAAHPATGVLYTVTGPTQLGAYFLFSWIGFWGLYLFHRAFVRACPDGDHWRYARLVFLLPALLFCLASLAAGFYVPRALGIVVQRIRVE